MTQFAVTTRIFDFDNAAGERLSGRLQVPERDPLGWALFAHCFPIPPEPRLGLPH